MSEPAPAMRSHVEFRSNKFPPYEGEEDQINPGLWGKRLAEYLQPKLREHGIKAGEFYSEDWGWAIPVEHDAFPIWIGCGHQYEPDDAFLIFIEPSKPQIRQGLFKKVDTRADVERVASALDRILRADPDIREIHWTDSGEKS
ncbi:MAG: hypothetical protein ACXW3Z_02155 [Limisphaerales bacterium]